MIERARQGGWVIGFIARHGLWSDEQEVLAQSIVHRVARGDFTKIRVGVTDPHGIMRSRTAMPDFFREVLREGMDFPSAQFFFDSGERFHPGALTVADRALPGAPTGLGDLTLVPDPRTFVELPWASGTGWILGDLYTADGEPFMLDARHLYRRALAELESRGMQFVAGMEMEFYLFAVLDGQHGSTLANPVSNQPMAPVVEALTPGYSHLSDGYIDLLDDWISVIVEYGERLNLQLRTVETEWGPGQLEVSSEKLYGLEAADKVVLFRTMVKQVSARRGYHASFMAQPGLPGCVPSGWHLNQSLADNSGVNLFIPDAGTSHLMSPLGQSYLRGLTRHAAAASIFTTPTINGYRRRHGQTLAPAHISWGLDDRSAMCRIRGGVGDPGTRIENRVGEPAANPYAYLASQIISGLDGVAIAEEGKGKNATGQPETGGERLPASLREAVESLDSSELFRRALGDAFVDWKVRMKSIEVALFEAAETGWDPNSPVTDWEHREYFGRY